MEAQKPQRLDRSRWGVLLLAHGAPDRLGDIPEFLLRVRGGRELPQETVQEIIRRYATIGGGSPLLRHTNRQSALLAKILGHPVYVGMRNWKPFIAESVKQASDDGLERIVALCLAPQNSRTSIGLYRRQLFDAVGQIAPELEVDFIESWHDHPQLIEAFREKVEPALARAAAEAGRPVPVIFTAHSVPEQTILDGDAYDRQVRETAELVAQALGPSRMAEWRVAFQSQGLAREPWIGPNVESQIDALANAGHQFVLLAPVGFVSDHVEILYDIDVVFRDYGRSKGIHVLRSESLNDSPQFIQALASIVTAKSSVKGATPGGS